MAAQSAVFSTVFFLCEELKRFDRRGVDGHAEGERGGRPLRVASGVSPTRSVSQLYSRLPSASYALPTQSHRICILKRPAAVLLDNFHDLADHNATLSMETRSPVAMVTRTATATATKLNRLLLLLLQAPAHGCGTTNSNRRMAVQLSLITDGVLSTGYATLPSPGDLAVRRSRRFARASLQHTPAHADAFAASRPRRRVRDCSPSASGHPCVRLHENMFPSNALLFTASTQLPTLQRHLRRRVPQ